jgi:pimeloyl-ACP methyl ester carboxylesterase
MRKLLRRIVIALGLLIGILYVLVHVYILINENKMVFVGADLSKKERLTINDEVSIPWDTVRVTTEDEVGILLLESLQADTPEAPWIIYFYGQAGQLADVGNLARYKIFRSTGLNVLALEYRGYGASEKKEPTEEGVYTDARAAWRHLTEARGVPASQVVIYGDSLGGGVAIQLATEMSPAGLITEGTFISIPVMIRIESPWVITLLIQNRFENLEKARSLSLPWLIFHGRRDSRVPFAHAESLAGTKAGVRRLVPLECGHEDAFEVEADQMERAIKEFVGELFGLEHCN